MSAIEILTSFMPRLLYSQFFVTPPKPITDCTGKTVIITGANVGLGKEAARHFVLLNAKKVILACRSAEKGETAKADIEQSTGRKGVVDVWSLDLVDYDSVKAFAERVKGLERVDIVIENAGVETREFKLAGGYETTVTVNVVSTFLLALLLMPKLQEVSRNFNMTPTLTIVSSELQFMAQFNESKSPEIFKALNDPKKTKMMDRYPTTKLIEVLVCRELVRLHPITDTKVTLNFVNPGWCHSELMREHTGFFVNLMKRMVARTTEVGSRTLVHAGLAGPDTNGKYLSDARVRSNAASVEGSKGPELQRRVWKELSDILEGIQPGVTKVLDN